MTLALLLAPVGCAQTSEQDSPAANDELTSLVLALTTVPSDVACVRVVVAGNQTVTRNFDVTPGGSANLAVTGLPVGSATVYEETFAVACASVGANTPATWVAEAKLPVTLTSGQTPSITIVLRRPGGLQITSDFQNSANGLVLSLSSADFGPTVVGAVSTSVTFTVTNSNASASTVPVPLTDSAEFAITSSTCTGMVLPAGASCTITLQFAPTTVGARTGTLAVGSATAVLSGVGISPTGLSLSPTTADFGNIIVGSSSGTLTFTVRNGSAASSAPLQVALAGPSALEFAITASTCTGSVLPPAAICTLALRFIPTSVGPKTATLTVGTTTAPLSGTGSTAPALTLSPATAAFGNITVGSSSSTFTFTVANGSTATSTPLQVTLAGPNPLEFAITSSTCTGSVLAAGASCTVALRFIPTSAGPKTATLVVGTTTAVLNGTGSSGTTLTLYPATADFGNVTVGSSSGAFTFTVTNSSTSATSAPLQETLAGPNPMEFAITSTTCAGSVLAAGASCTVALRFVPTSAGSRTATLAVGTTTAVLNGTGVVAWSTQDIGAVGPAGSWTESAGTHTVRGSGGDIWNNADAFRYVYKNISGDATLTARVASIQNTDVWAKAGPMIRENTTAGARNVAAFLTPSAGNAYRLQTRTALNGATTSVGGGAGTGPAWLRLVRAGSSLTAFFSADGTTWTALGAPTALALPASLLFGLAVTSHNTGVLATGQFDSVTITQP